MNASGRVQVSGVWTAGDGRFPSWKSSSCVRASTALGNRSETQLSEETKEVLTTVADKYGQSHAAFESIADSLLVEKW